MVQPSLQPPGGGNGVAAWMLEALRGEYTLAVYTWNPLNVEAINHFYGTSLSADAIDASAVPAALRILIDAAPLPLSLLKTSLLLGLARRHASRYDVLVSANNEMDLGRRGIQYVHYPAYLRPRPLVDIRWYHLGLALDAYYWLCDRLANWSMDRIVTNLTLVNSDWTAAIFRARHGGAPRTLYPPVTGPFPEVPWDRRQNDFVCAGRMSPEKDLDSVIDIVEAVRRVHPDVRLHVIGSRGPRRYTRHVLGRIARRREWITLHLDVAHDEVRHLVTASRYGLHAMPGEHFGMAPAEMATGGNIVWVRADGGQMEIVGHDPRLIFRSVDDAVAKILRTMADPAEQTALRAHLASVTPQFAVERFIEDVRAAAHELA